jgi:hypothetical protein
MLKESLVSDDAAAPDELASSRKCPHCGGELLTMLAQIERRLVVPATACELADLFEIPVRHMTAHLYYLQDRKRAVRTDKSVPHKRKHGRQRDYLWVRA